MGSKLKIFRGSRGVSGKADNSQGLPTQPPPSLFSSDKTISETVLSFADLLCDMIVSGTSSLKRLCHVCWFMHCAPWH